MDDLMSDEDVLRDRVRLCPDEIAIRDDAGQWWCVVDQPGEAVRQLLTTMGAETGRLREVIRNGNESLSNANAQIRVLERQGGQRDVEFNDAECHWSTWQERQPDSVYLRHVWHGPAVPIDDTAEAG